jgi:hypothetical protein
MGLFATLPAQAANLPTGVMAQSCGQLPLGRQYIGSIAGGLPAVTPRLIHNAILREQSKARDAPNSPHQGDGSGGLTQRRRTTSRVKDDDFTLLGQRVFHHDGNRGIIYPRCVNPCPFQGAQLNKIAQRFGKAVFIASDGCEKSPDPRLGLNQKQQPGVISGEFEGNKGRIRTQVNPQGREFPP